MNTHGTHPYGAGVPRTLTRSTRSSIFWCVAVLLTVLNALVVGWFSVYFQLFGERPDAGDYASAAGGYGAGAVLLLLFAGATFLRRDSRAASPVVAAIAAVLGGIASFLCLAAWTTSAGMTPDSFTFGTWTDGAGGVVLSPFTWPLAGGTLWLLVSASTSGSSEPDPRRPAR